MARRRANPKGAASVSLRGHRGTWSTAERFRGARPRARQSPGSADAAKASEVRSTGIARPVCWSVISMGSPSSGCRGAADHHLRKLGSVWRARSLFAVSVGKWSIARSATGAPWAASARADPAASVCDEDDEAKDDEAIPRHQHDPPLQPLHRRRARSKGCSVSRRRAGITNLPVRHGGPVRLRFGGDAASAARRCVDPRPLGVGTL
jgi:hypothetical protein